MNWRWLLSSIVVGLISVGGCQDAAPLPPTAGTSIKTTAEQLTDAELQRFLRLIERFPEGRVPEFTPAEQPPLDTLLPPKVLVSEFRSRYRQLSDPHRQGEVWDASLDLSKTAQQEGWTSAQLAAFIRCLSCAVMKSQLAEKHDLNAIEQRCRREITRLVAVLDQDDDIPRSQMNEAFMQRRDQKVQRLGRMVALLEFTLQLKPIPQSNLDLVTRYARQIRPLLPEATTEDPFVAPFAEESTGQDIIVPASYQTN